MTTVNLQIAASADDAQQTLDGTTVIDGTTTNNDLDETTDWVGLRFLLSGGGPSQGATITSATLSVMPTNSGRDEPEVTIFAQDADSTDTFAATSNNISGRPRTTASVLWDVADLGATGVEFFSAPDLAAVIQEVVDRPGFDGVSITLILQGVGADEFRDLRIVTFDGTPANSAKLVIEFTEGGGTEVPLAGDMPAPSGSIAVTGTGRVLAGDMPAPSGTASSADIRTDITGDQPAPSGAITVTGAGRRLAGDQPAPSGALAFTWGKAHVSGNQPAPSGRITFFRSASTLFGNQPSPSGEVLIARYVEQPQGFTGIEFLRPDGTVPTGMLGAVQKVLAWETKRYTNRVGAWTAQIPLGEPLAGTDPLSTLVTRGWKASIIQENNHPLDRLDLEYLMYQGVVENVEVNPDVSGQSVLFLEGSFRAIALASKATPTVVAYADDSVSAVATDIEGGLAGGISVTNGSALVNMTFGGEESNGVISRYARLLALAKFSGMVVRETWEGDALELVSIYDAPDSGYFLINQEASTSEQHLAGKRGFALIGGTPKIRRDGSGVVNMVIPFGVDDDGAPLTVQHSNKSAPYTILPGENPDGSFYWYLEDTLSVNRHGRIEMPIHNSSIKNPSDNQGTRELTADVLYAWATGELLKNRSPKLFVDLPVANGAQVWALPGDKIKMQYTGKVTIDGVEVIWQDMDKWFLVVERTDSSDPSGVRQVSFVLAAPEIEIHLPDLPDAVILPVTDSPGGGGPGGGGTGPGGKKPPGGGEPYPDCCDDPTVDVPETDPDLDPPDEIEENEDDGGGTVGTTFEGPDAPWVLTNNGWNGTQVNNPPTETKARWNLQVIWNELEASSVPEPDRDAISGSLFWGDGTSSAFSGEVGDVFVLPGVGQFHDYGGAPGPYTCYIVVSDGITAYDSRLFPGGTIDILD